MGDMSGEYAGHERTGVMAADIWHDNGPRDLVTVPLCIQIAIDKMQLGLLSVTYACPYHDPTSIIGHSDHNVDISKHRWLTPRHTRYCLPTARYS